MKKILYTIACSLVFGLSSCQDLFLDLNPLDARTDAVYFKKASDFKEYATGFSGQLLGWGGSTYGSVYEHMDVSTDLSTYFAYSGDIAHGTIQVSTEDKRWGNCYAQIRTVNILLEKAKAYPGSQSEIQQYLSEAHFFRAYNYFYLLKFFGGVPILTTVLDVNSSELKAPRSSRYEVMNLILSDLEQAIAGLPKDQNIPANEKGRIGYYGAKAFKARVLLYEATWRKYNGTSTDFEGSAGPARDQINEFLDEAVALCTDVIANGKYTIWNYNNQNSMQKMSSRYLFCLEDASSNPAGLTKASNNEFIIYSIYDRTLKPGGINLNQTLPKMNAGRKFVDMFVCTDGLPITKSPRFMGYVVPGDEFLNRDYRLKSYIGTPDATITLTNGTSGYQSAKFQAPAGTENLKESANYPVLRLAEVYLTYAEALYERNSAITDEQLNRSINILRNRAGIKYLDNALVTNNGLDMLEEIRRERTVELYMEGHRFDDLKRWGIAADAMNKSRYGMIVGSADYPTAFVSADGKTTKQYNRSAYVWGEEKVETPLGKLTSIVIDSKVNFNFTKIHYLWPIPQQQINLNPNLKQNPGYDN